MARKLAYEKMGKAMKWALYGEWTNREQQRHKQRNEQAMKLVSLNEVRNRK
jgi:hypothetical protein